MTIKPGPGLVDLVAFRDDDDPTWQGATPGADGSYTIAVHGPYWVGVVCHFEPRGNSNSYQVRQLGRSLSDPTELDEAFCVAPTSPPPPPTTVTITGTINAKGRARLGPVEQLIPYPFPPGDFILDVPPATYDLYLATADRMRIFRHLDATVATVIPPIDMSTGTPLVTAPLDVTNAGQDALTASVAIQPAGGAPFTYYEGDPAGATLPQDGALLASNERLVLEATATSKTRSHTITRAISQPYELGTPPTVALPDLPAQLNWALDEAPISVRWFSVPEKMAFQFSVTGYGHGINEQRQHAIELSAAFVKDTASRGVSLETTMPGFQPTWEISPDNISMANTSGQGTGDPATEPVATISDQWLIAIID